MAGGFHVSTARGVPSEWVCGVLLLIGGIICVAGWLTPPEALAVGVALALVVGNPHAARTAAIAKLLLQAAVAALGFGMDLHGVIRAGVQGFWFAAATITFTWAAGYVLGRWLRMSPVNTTLVCAGTAICGGSAIAAVGAVIAAGEAEMSVSLATVFLLNAVALFVFPPIGHYLGMSQAQFGTWAGVAIHDISSVVGAASSYGQQALQVATAVKLSRALWIVPVSLAASLVYRRSVNKATAGPARIHLPWFIGMFLLASVSRLLVPAVADAAPLITTFAGRILTLSLFLIGTGLTRHTLHSVGPRALVLGVLLWLGISLGSLAVIDGQAF